MAMQQILSETYKKWRWGTRNNALSVGDDDEEASAAGDLMALMGWRADVGEARGTAALGRDL